MTRLVARALVLAAVLSLLLPIALARAASYVVRSCSNGSRSGWTAQPAARGSDTCRAGGGGALSGAVLGGANEQAAWVFTAPPDTEIAGFSVTRSYRLGGGVAFGTPVWRLATYGPGHAYNRSDPNFSPVARFGSGTERASGLVAQRTLEAAVFCGGGGTCVPPAASFDLSTAAIELSDDYDPVVENVSGSLLADGPVSGLATVRYTAADRGGGVARAELRLDDQLVADGIADLNGGACAPDRGEFATAAPCRARATNTLTADTRRIADGRHTLTLRVLDATGVNHADWTTTIDVDNVPPPENRVPPAITGTAIEGATLTASPGTWTGAHPAFAYRWQRYDGGWADVPGASSPTYLLQSDDVGHRLRVRVSATDPEGTGIAYSAPTAHVTAAPDDPGPTPVPSPTPAADDPGSGGPSGGGGGGGASGGSSSPSAAAAVHARLAFAGGASRHTALTADYGREVVVRGDVADAHSSPLAGVRIDLLESVDGDWRAVRAGRTLSDGSFALSVATGPSRRPAVTAGAVRSRTLTLTVRAAVRLRVARDHGRALVRGSLLGGHVPRGGVLVSIQRRHAGRWRTATTLLTDGRGRFGARVGLPPGARRDRIRATVPRQPGYPFTAGRSQPE